MKTREKENKSLKIIQMTVIALLLALLIPSERLSRSVITGIAFTGILGSMLFLVIPKMPRISAPSFLKRIRLPKIAKRQKQKETFFDIETLLIRQVSYQITDTLKSAYPEASWEYTKPLKVESLLNCDTFRIRTFHTEEFIFADVALDRYGHLKLFLTSVRDLTPLPGQKNPDAPNAEPSSADSSNAEPLNSNPQTEPPLRVDPESWYSLIGKPLLTDLIGDLQARGHRKLFINETGELFILNGNSPEVKATFEYFPPKDYWTALTDIFIRDELKVAENNNTLEL